MIPAVTPCNVEVGFVSYVFLVRLIGHGRFTRGMIDIVGIILSMEDFST
jgi:hypothetical protein